MLYIPHELYCYFKILWASFLNTFVAPEIAVCINIHVSFSLSKIMVSG